MPANQQCFLWCSQNGFQLNPSSFFSNIYHHGPGLHRLCKGRMAHTKQGLILPLAHLSPHAVVILYLPWSKKTLQKNTLVWLVSFMRASQPHRCCSPPCGISCRTCDDRKQEQGHLSQVLKGSTSRLSATVYALVTINRTCLLTSELWF